MQYVTFELEGASFGIPIYLVQEFSRSFEISPIVGHDSRIAGFINLRGRIATVIDLKRCLQREILQDGNPLDGSLSWGQQKMIILETNDRLTQEAQELGIVGYEEPLVLLVDQIRDVIEVDSADYYPPPANVQAPFIEGIVKKGGCLYSLISVNQLTEELAQEQKEIHTTNVEH